MYGYLVPFLVYIITTPLVNYGYMLIIRFFLVLSLILAFSEYYKFKLKPEFFPVLIGAIIFLFWVLLDGYYPLIGKTYYAAGNNILLIFRILSFVAIAPVVEEFFVRNFLARILINNNWKKVRLGTFTTASFVMTTLFFGFSHNRWLPGLIAGALLNYAMSRKKNMGSVILAHATANALLAAYIIYTGSWNFW